MTRDIPMARTDGSLVAVLVSDSTSGRSWRFMLNRAGQTLPWDARYDVDVPALHLDTEAIDDVRDGRITGSQAVLSNRVRFRGDWADLLPFWSTPVGHGQLMTDAWRTPGPTVGRPMAGPDRPGGDIPKKAEPLVVAVLGAPNDAEGNLSVMAADRLTCAADLLGGVPGGTLVLTGGMGPQFNTTDRPHWAHCRAHLAARGPLPAPVLACLDSRHTYEDLLLLREVLRYHDVGSAVVVTSNYHAARVRYLAGLVVPSAVVCEVRHPTLSTVVAERLRAHERTALGKIIAAALLFGADRLPAPPRRLDLGWSVRWTPYP